MAKKKKHSRVEIATKLAQADDLATQGKLHELTRVWTLGNGVGFGRYPSSEGIWEGGHSVVTLDPKENFCGCGGRGHLEGILGRRSMRMRFLDLEPEEVFENARTGDARCAEFVTLCHRALAAATATTANGPGLPLLRTSHVKRRSRATSWAAGATVSMLSVPPRAPGLGCEANQSHPAGSVLVERS